MRCIYGIMFIIWKSVSKRNGGRKHRRKDMVRSVPERLEAEIEMGMGWLDSEAGFMCGAAVAVAWLRLYGLVPSSPEHRGQRKIE